MTELTFQTKVHATAKEIWEMYVDFNKRRQWETDLEYIILQGTFSTGTSGRMKLQGQPEMPYTLTKVIPYKEYWDKSEIPGMGIAICFGHEFNQIDNETTVKISVRLEKETGEMMDEDIQFLVQVFSDTPQSILTIKKVVEK
jgi:hypothetical protein